ncbi:hypothetical protein EV426DRAFT_611582 [Tirmania nivea]|nr:hypothetical protein EV426DRAFT_611582 [Tirmania nivea]
MHLDYFVLGWWVHISSGCHCSAVPCLEKGGSTLGGEGNSAAGKGQNVNQQAWERWYERLDAKIENKTEILIEKSRLNFLSFLSSSQNKTDDINTISNDLASLKTMTSVLYFIIISGVVDGGGVFLAILSKIISAANQNSIAQVQQEQPQDQAQQGQCK